MVVSAKQCAVKLLARREHSELEIRNKLHQREYDAAEIASAIEELITGGWLSDERYTENYVQVRRRKGYGPERIALELRQRGVDDHIAARYLEADASDWTDSLHRVYRRKYGDRPVTDYADQARRMRFLQYRGFSTDAIYEIFNKNNN